MANEADKLAKIANLVKTIVKNMDSGELDWTYQESISSVHLEKRYAVMIASPADGLQPLTWVCDSYKELYGKLEASAKVLDKKAVMKAWHEAEIERAKRLMEYHQEKLEES